MSNFSIRLKELRASKSLTQQELADYIKISKSSINMYERGEREPGIETLEAFADFFNVDMDYLIGKTSIPNKCLLNNNYNGYSELEREIINHCKKLNNLGKEKAKDYISDLSENPKYIQKDISLANFGNLVAEGGELNRPKKIKLPHTTL